MRDLRFVRAHQLRDYPATREAGVFVLPHGGVTLRIIATTTDRWDHVSISLPNRCPTWEELELVKRCFFEDHETAMQLHVPPEDHINNSEYCLHLWRPQDVDIPRPPGWMVGLKGKSPEEIRALKLGVFHADAF